MGKKSTSTKSTPWAPAQPILLGAGQGIENTFNQNQGNLSNIESGLTGSTIPSLQSAIANGQQMMQPGENYLNGVLGGQYLNSNPYVTQMANYAGQQAANQVNGTFSAAGRTGSNANQVDLAKGVALGEMQPLMQNYQQERANQQQAAGMLPGYNASQFAGYSPLLSGTQLAGQLPYYGSQTLSGVGGLYGGYGTQTQPGGWGTGLLGAASNMFSFAPIPLSDRRLKRDIVKIGEEPDGLGVYTFSYSFDPDRTIYKGVMADEVKQLRPWAYIDNVRDGYAGVDYAKLQEAA